MVNIVLYLFFVLTSAAAVCLLWLLSTWLLVYIMSMNPWAQLSQTASCGVFVSTYAH